MQADPSATAATAVQSSTDSQFIFDGLTGLRFFAAFFVFLGHTDQFFLFDPTGTLRQMSLGVCVTLFFVLSGFVLTHAYEELPSATSVKDFLIARLAKIWPIHAVTLMLFLVAIKNQPADIDIPSLLASLFLVQDWIPFRNFYLCFNTPAWSLSVELFFYLAFPILIAGKKRFLTAFLVGSYLLTACMIVGSDFIFSQARQEEFCHYFAYWSPLTRLADFVLGMQTYVLYTKHATKIRQFKLPWNLIEIATISALIFWMVTAKNLSHILVNSAALPEVRTGFETWLASASPAIVCAAIIFLTALGKGWISRGLATKPLIFWGDRSFILYMIHFPIYALVLNSQTGWQPAAPLLLFLCVSILALTGSDFLFKTVEVPARRFIRKKWTDSSSHSKQTAAGQRPEKLFLVLEGLFLLVFSGFFYFNNEIVHGRRMLPGSQSVKFGDLYDLESAYWETNGANALLELNWRNTSDHSGPHQVLLQTLKVPVIAPEASLSSKLQVLKSKEVAMEDSTRWKKNQSLKMRLYFSPADLANANEIELTVHDEHASSSDNIDGSGRRSDATPKNGLILQIPVSSSL